MCRHPVLLALLVCSVLAGAPAAALGRDASPDTDGGKAGRELPLGSAAAEAGPSVPWPGLALLAGLLAGGVLVARRRGAVWAPPWRVSSAAGPGLVRMGAQALTPQASLHVVRWNGEELLLGCGPQQLTVLARRPAPEEAG